MHVQVNPSNKSVAFAVSCDFVMNGKVRTETVYTLGYSRALAWRNRLSAKHRMHMAKKPTIQPWK